MPVNVCQETDNKKKLNNKLIKLFSWLRVKLQTSNFLTYSFILFLSGFFLFPDDHLHRQFFYLFVVLPFLLIIDISFIKTCFKSKIFLASLLFLTYYASSIVWTQNVEVTLENYYDTVRYFLLLIVFIMITIYLSNKDKYFINKVIFWLSMSAAISAILSLIIFYNSHVITERVTGFNHYLRYTIIASTYFGFICICTIYAAIHSKMVWQKFIFYIITSIVLTFMLLSQSRGPLLSLIFALFLGLILDKRYKTVGIEIAFIIICFILMKFSEIDINNYIYRGTIDYRFAIWQETLERIFKSLCFGEGFLTNLKINALNRLWCHPHNIFLIILLKSGIIGILLFFNCLIISIIIAIRYFNRSKDFLFIILIIFSILASSSDLIILLGIPRKSWIIFWFPVAMLSAKELQMRGNR